MGILIITVYKYGKLEVERAKHAHEALHSAHPDVEGDAKRGVRAAGDLRVGLIVDGAVAETREAWGQENETGNRSITTTGFPFIGLHCIKWSTQQ
jgi:hypothetical protein